VVQQVMREHGLDQLKHWLDQPGQRDQRHAQRSRRRQYPLPRRHIRPDSVDQEPRRATPAARCEERNPRPLQPKARSLS
jgi:hypothetical protein